MVRYIRRPPSKALSPQEIRKRAKSQNVVRPTEFVDPYPDVLGTKPEKIVYAELMARGIYATYRSDFLVNIPEIELFKYYKPDFVIPDARIVIEVQGTYFHSQPQAIEDDSYKQALYAVMGYKVLAWWDYEIESDVDELFAREPLLGYRTVPQGRIYTADPRHDDLKGLRKANASRKKPKRFKSVTIKNSKKRKKLSKTAYKV